MESSVPRARRAPRFALVGAAVFAWLGISVLVACGGGGGDGEVSRGTVGFDGGTVSMEGGPEIEILAGALPGDSQDFSVTIGKSTLKPSLPGGVKNVGDADEIGPQGATFSMPVRIALPIPEGE